MFRIGPPCSFVCNCAKTIIMLRFETDYNAKLFSLSSCIVQTAFRFFISFLPEKAGLLIILTKYTVPAGVLLNLFVVHVANRRIKYCCLICLRECKQKVDICICHRRIVVYFVSTDDACFTKTTVYLIIMLLICLFLCNFGGK